MEQDINNVQDALKILETHNKWRRGADIPMVRPKTLGEAIDLIVATYKK